MSVESTVDNDRSGEIERKRRKKKGVRDRGAFMWTLKKSNPTRPPAHTFRVLPSRAELNLGYLTYLTNLFKKNYIHLVRQKYKIDFKQNFRLVKTCNLLPKGQKL